MRVVAGMSGGVDSSVAAAMLVEAGHEVIGVHLSLKGEFGKPHPSQTHGCGSSSDAEDARQICDQLGIRFEIWNLAADFKTNVVDYFIAEYQQGRTPNPCLRCNATIKFAGLLSEALRRGFQAVGTGHYARVDPNIPALYRAKNFAKDQSYVLSVLKPHQLRHTLFPLGEFESKTEVRSRAAQLGLSVVAGKPDSTDICFIPDKDTAGFLRRHIPDAPGAIVDESGQIVGEHRGTHQFTIGQRKGLRLGKPAPDGQPRYVLGIEPTTNTVRVGTKQSGEVAIIEAKDANWLVEQQERRCLVQIRAHGEPLPAVVRPYGTELSVLLDEPTAGVAAGQGVVCYDGDRVLAQAIITSATK